MLTILFLRQKVRNLYTFSYFTKSYSVKNYFKSNYHPYKFK